MMPVLALVTEGAKHSSTKCSPDRAFLGRELIVPHLENLPSFQKQQQTNPYSLEEQMDQIYENMRQQDEVRIRR